jgi:hypothetical protein
VWRHTAACAVVAAELFLTSPLAAQTLTPGPPGPYVVDLRAVTMSEPKDPAFFPAEPSGTLVPARGFGFDGGAHIYAGSLGQARLGFGASLLRVRGTATSPQATSTTTSRTPLAAPPAHRPDMVTTITAFAPQVSLNFGTENGWSYLSAGYGTARILTSEAGVPQPAARRVSGIPAVNIGAGARWFFASRLALGFDIRFYRLSGRSARGTPPAMFTAASVGLSLR